jgi:NAD(P)-dependent dehydrogenase (short-subunit alcohol dehydrogenase family)
MAHGACVLLFAGGGTNDAPLNYSAYTISKIALIKMCELLDAEIPDTRFVIVGPGVVQTKIHRATVEAGARAGQNAQRAREALEGSHCTPMERVLDCCDWVVEAPRESISGRNFSIVFDAWGTEALERQLMQDPDLYKLRRSGNDRLVKHESG